MTACSRSRSRSSTGWPRSCWSWWRAGGRSWRWSACCVWLAVFSLGIEAGLFRTGSRDRANEQQIASTLRADRDAWCRPAAPLRRLRPPHGRRVRRHELPLPRRRLAVRAAGRPDLRRPVPEPPRPSRGAREGAGVADRDARAAGLDTNTLWVRPGALQDALAQGRACSRARPLLLGAGVAAEVGVHAAVAEQPLAPDHDAERAAQDLQVERRATSARRTRRRARSAPPS